jgi:hypothetical protein
MDSTKLGTKWVKVSHHRPHMPGSQFRREPWNTPSPAQSRVPLPKANAPEKPATGNAKKEKQKAPATPVTPDTGCGNSASKAKSSNAPSTTASLSNSNVEEITELLSNVNLDEITLEELSVMMPTRVLKIITSAGNPLLRRLDIAKCERKLLPTFWGEEPQRLDIIRYVNGVAQVALVGEWE